MVDIDDGLFLEHGRHNSVITRNITRLTITCYSRSVTLPRRLGHYLFWNRAQRR